MNETPEADVVRNFQQLYDSLSPEDQAKMADIADQAVGRRIDGKTVIPERAASRPRVDLAAPIEYRKNGVKITRLKIFPAPPPPVDLPNGKAAQRRLRQLARQQAKREAAQAFLCERTTTE